MRSSATEWPFGVTLAVVVRGGRGRPGLDRPGPSGCYGVIAMAPPPMPTAIGLPTVLVAVQIGNTGLSALST